MSIRYDKRNRRYRWEFARTINGQRLRFSKLLPAGWSQAQADAYDRTECARQYAIAAGVSTDSPLIDDAVTLYVQGKTALKSYKKTVEQLAAIAWAYAGRRMDALPEICATIIRTETARGMSPATIRNRLACLKAACRYAWKTHGLTPDDPTQRMQMPVVRNARHFYAGRLAMLRIARLARHHQTRVAIRVAFYTGMRLGELWALRVQGKTLVLTDTKNGDMRAVPASPRIAGCLQYLPLKINRSTLRADWVQARDAAGLSHLHFHDLRHSAASEMINGGVSLYTVGAVLGHRDARSTSRYSHLQAEQLAQAVATIGAKKRSA